MDRTLHLPSGAAAERTPVLMGLAASAAALSCTLAALTPALFLALGIGAVFLGSVGGLLPATIAWHIAFPKAGFKIGSVPVTIADVLFGILLGITTIRYASGRLGKLRSSEAPCAKYLIIGITFFTLRIAVAIVQRSFLPDDVANLTALCIYPLVFLVLLTTDFDEHSLRPAIVLSFGVLAMYGLLQKLFGQDTVLIAGLTANWHDAQTPGFLLDKMNLLNDFGDVKLTGTYQNGNLLGINTLLLLPVATVFCRGYFRIVIATAGIMIVVFSASRAAWAGLIFLAALTIHLLIRRWSVKILIVALVALAIFGFLTYSDLAATRIQDSQNVADWAGRLGPAGMLVGEALHASPRALLTGIHTQMELAYEIFYLAIFEVFGLIGTLLWAAPIFISLRAFYRQRQDPIIRAVILALITWMFAAIAEGAYWLPPTAFNLWMIVAIGWLRLRTIGDGAVLT